MVERIVYGSYSSNQEALQAAENLVENKGVPAKAVTLVGNEASLEGYNGSYEVIAADTVPEAENEGGFFNSLFGGFFAPDEEQAARNQADVDVEGYRNSLNSGEVLVLVDGDYEASLRDGNHAHTDNVNAHGADRENVKLHEERLNAEVHEDAASSGDVHIEKRVVENEETVDIPVRREEVHVNRRDVADDKAVGDKAFQEEEIDVHVSNEAANVNKETVVTGEVDIEKESRTDHETVTDKTRKEVLDVDDDTKRHNNNDRV